mgnify:FL=1
MEDNRNVRLGALLRVLLSAIIAVAHVMPLGAQEAPTAAALSLRLPVTRAITPANARSVDLLTEPVAADAVRFSADGRLMVLGRRNGAWLPIDLATALVVGPELPPAADGALSGDGSKLALAVDDVVEVYPLSARWSADGGPATNTAVPLPPADQVAFGLDGSLITLEPDGRITRWNTDIRPLSFSGAYGGLGARFGAGVTDRVLAGNAVVGAGVELPAVAPEGEQIISFAAIAPGGTQVAEGAATETLALLTASGRAYTSAGGGPLERVPGAYPGTTIAVHPTGAMIAVGAEDGTIELIDAAAGSVLHRLDHRAPVDQLAFSPDGSLLVSIGGGSALLWGVERPVNLTELLSFTYGAETTRRVLARANPELAEAEVTLLDVFLRRGVAEGAGEYLDLPLATSFLPDDGEYRLYGEEAAFDNDLNTSWVEGVDGPGIGEAIAFEVTRPSESASLEIYPGWGQEAFFPHNHRIRRADISVYALRRAGGTGLLAPSRRVWSLQVELEDEAAFVRIPLDLPDRREGERFMMIIRVLDVYEGITYDDLCIAEIRLLDEAENELSIPRQR